MTNEELERIMNFMIEREERIFEQQERFSVEMREQQELARILLNAQVSLTEKQAQQDEKQAQQDERIARFERSYTTIAGLLQRHDSQIVALTENSNNTTAVVAALVTTVEQLSVKIESTNANVDRLSANVELTRANVDRLSANLELTRANVDRLSVVVERYIAARSNGANGSSNNEGS